MQACERSFVKFLVICKQMVGNLINNQDNDCF